jgi:hypothetical protein
MRVRRVQGLGAHAVTRRTPADARPTPKDRCRASVGRGLTSEPRSRSAAVVRRYEHPEPRQEVRARRPRECPYVSTTLRPTCDPSCRPPEGRRWPREGVVSPVRSTRTGGDRRRDGSAGFSGRPKRPSVTVTLYRFPRRIATSPGGRRPPIADEGGGALSQRRAGDAKGPSPLGLSLPA